MQLIRTIAVMVLFSLSALAQEPAARSDNSAEQTGAAQSENAQSAGPHAKYLAAYHWRNVGPFRGGRTRAVAGVPSQPSVFYIAQVNGGIFKTNDFGHTWTPIFDSQPTASIGALAVAPSDPNVVYAGSGEGLHRPDLSVGNGLYRSSDAGKTWTHLGLRDGQQIPQIAVDPRDANRILVAVAGHPYGPNAERGIFRSTDGGKTFDKVLYKDENIGGADVLFDPANPDIAYASLWEAREGPWENGSWNGTGGGIYKSADNGKTWTQLTGGLPQGISQANLGISRSNPQRLFATVATQTEVKIYRTDDAGANWQVITDDPRPAGRIGGGDLSVPRVDPKNPEVVIVASTVTWRSTDGGKTWTGIRGAPGGDDYQNVWINPDNPDIIMLGSDQGAVISVNGGQSWSSWYNQPTAQLYHVGTDNAFPYRLCAGQQESGSVCISSRGNDGEITMRDWHPVAAEEYGYVTPDPVDPDIVYGGKLSRYDRRTGQAQNILPRPLRDKGFRVIRTEPVVFAPNDPHTLYFAANTLWMTKDQGRTWKQISPDLTRKTFDVPATVGKYKSAPTAQPMQRGVIYAVAPSPLDAGRIWAGTDDGLIHLTLNGGAAWKDVTPKQLTPFQKVSVIEASHFDKNTAYAAINTIRLDDLRPHILRTRDGGQSWQEIVNGIGQQENVNAVHEDPQRKGLLFAATERGVWVSFNDGDNWESLRLNLPATSVRDLTIKGDDLAIATHGRGFWILDDMTALRQWDDSHGNGDVLFKPQTAMRVRWDTNSDTPLPPDYPAGENPPDGAVIDYLVAQDSSQPITLEIRDSAGKAIRKYSSADPVPEIDPMLPVPKYWVRPPQVLSAKAGLHRFVWDEHLEPIPGAETELPISAVYKNTVPSPTSPWAMPGQYTVALTVGGKTITQPLELKMDPRVKTPTADLARQFSLSQQAYEDLQKLSPAYDEAKKVRDQLKKAQGSAKGDAGKTAQLDDFSNKLAAIAGGGGGRRGPAAAAETPTLNGLGNKILALLGMMQEADVAPTAAMEDSLREAHGNVATVLSQWQSFKTNDLPPMKSTLEAAH